MCFFSFIGRVHDYFIFINVEKVSTCVPAKVVYKPPHSALSILPEKLPHHNQFRVLQCKRCIKGTIDQMTFGA